MFPERLKYTDEQIAKMKDEDCDIAIAALAMAIEVAKICLINLANKKYLIIYLMFKTTKKPNGLFSFL